MRSAEYNLVWLTSWFKLLYLGITKYSFPAKDDSYLPGMIQSALAAQEI